MVRRVSIELPGFGHANPIPVAARIGSLLVSGVLTGRDLVTRTTDDILKMTFWLADPRDRDALNREWLAMFPDPTNRPARQAMAAQLDGGALVHCDLMAMLDVGTP
jgi:enamine deaminase RidA (YjgF/YER057c/UK114 family)